MADRPENILVVDDDAESGQNLAAALESFGYRAQFITDPRAVLGTVTRQRPDMVMLDIGMTGLEAFDLAGILKRGFPAILVVAISGRDSDEYRKRGRKVGFDAYIATPIDPPIVRRVLETLFAARSAG